MSLVPFPPPPTNGDDNKNSSYSAKSPPLSVDSLAPSSPSFHISRDPIKLKARSCLYEICAKSHWKHPEFTFCNEKGPANLRSFTYKAVVEMTQGSKSMIVIECIGKPQSNKKNAADSAAEGVLWYLVHLDYQKKHECPK